jgi:hypothetical protein
MIVQLTHITSSIDGVGCGQGERQQHTCRFSLYDILKQPPRHSVEVAHAVGFRHARQRA